MSDNIVYFILDPTTNNVKIGYTTLDRMRPRLKELQIGSSSELKLLGTVWGGKSVESRLHEKFQDSWVRGEWFKWTEELQTFITTSWDFELQEQLDSKLVQDYIITPKKIKGDVMESAEFLKEINQNERVIVDFWAEWCSPCRALHPILDDISKSTDIKVVKLNIDQYPDIAKEYQIRSIPTMLMFKNGENVNRVVGIKTKEEILSNIA